MDLDDEPVGPGGDGGAGHGSDFVAAAGAVRRFGHNRKMRELLHNRDCRDIHRVARVGLKCPDAALAQDHVVVAAGHDVLGRQQQLLDSRHNAALEQNGLALLAELAQQVEIPHIARRANSM